jgi:iron complex transport system substrate-binding protein
VSLVPAATELVFVLGAFDHVVGVSHECDFPPDVLKRPRLTASKVDAHLPARELDAAVKALGRRHEPLYELDVDALRGLKPDLIIAQTTCRVCAVTAEDVERVRGDLKPRPDVADFHPHSYEDVLAETRRMGELLHRTEEAKREIIKQWGLAKEIRGRTQATPRTRVAVLDWIDPPMFAGHWTQELVEMAHGDYGLVPKGEPSRWASWEELEEYEPDVIVATPCGRTLEAAADELARAVREHDLWDLAAVEQGRLYAADGNRFFNRPGPRLVYSAAILARILHPEAIPELPEALESGYARLEVPREGAKDS